METEASAESIAKASSSISAPSGGVERGDGEYEGILGTGRECPTAGKVEAAALEEKTNAIDETEKVWGKKLWAWKEAFLGRFSEGREGGENGGEATWVGAKRVGGGEKKIPYGESPFGEASERDESGGRSS